MTDDALHSGSGSSTQDPQVGDRVDVCLHGATSPNHAKGTVVDTNPATALKDAVKVDLDENYQNCDNPYVTSANSINEIIGGSR